MSACKETICATEPVSIQRPVRESRSYWKVTGSWWCRLCTASTFTAVCFFVAVYLLSAWGMSIHPSWYQSDGTPQTLEQVSAFHWLGIHLNTWESIVLWSVPVLMILALGWQWVSRAFKDPNWIEVSGLTLVCALLTPVSVYGAWWRAWCWMWYVADI